MKNSVKNYVALFVGVAALSTSAIFVKLSEAPSSITALYRLLFTALTLLPFLIFSKKNRIELKSLTEKQYFYIILSGFFLAVHYVMWFESLRFTSVASSTVLVALQPVFSIVFGFILLKEKISKSSAIGCLTAVLGSVSIGWGDFRISGAALVGDFLALAAAGVISLYFLVGQVVRSSVGTVTYSVVGYISSVVFLLIYSFIKNDSLTGYSSGTWLALIGLALISTIGGQFIFNMLLNKLSASAVTVSILGEPIGTCIFAYFILNETVSLRQLLGMAIILFGISVFFCSPKNKNV